MSRPSALPLLPMYVVATAGHVDHGKSSLVRALTGTDPDRLTEEKRRGLTIDLGFAWTELEGLDGGQVTFVDVPGHVRFLSNMLAGVAVVEAAVLCVDAGEGWRAQTEDHLRVLDLVGLQSGLVALTKVGQVDPDRVAAVNREVTGRVAGTVMERVPVVACDSVDGTGLDELRSRLAAVLAAMDRPADQRKPRLWVDRSFTIAGAGTVVTGGVSHGSLAVEDRVEIVGVGGCRTARVRGIEALGRPVERAEVASRAALNLAGVDRLAVRRGDAVVKPGQWLLTHRVGTTLEVLPTLDHDVTERGSYLANLGSGEHHVRLELPGATRLEPGGRGDVRLSWEHPLPLAPGDNYLLRETGRGEIVGGGTILDLAPPRRRAVRPTHPVTLEEVPPEYDWTRSGDLAQRFGVVVQPAVDDWVVSAATLRMAEAALTERIEATRPVGVDVDQLDQRDRAVLRRLERGGVARTVAGYAVGAAWRDELAADSYLALLERFPFRPPTPEEASVPADVLRALLRRRYVLVKQGVYFPARALTLAERLLAELGEGRPAGFTAGEARQALGTTRKWAIPLLELLDEARITLRQGDRRRVRTHPSGGAPLSSRPGGV